MEWVFDASITLAWCFPDEKTAAADALLDRLVAPHPAYQLTIYDAAYLELAMRLGVPLATLDVELRRASLATGVTLL